MKKVLLLILLATLVISFGFREVFAQEPLAQETESYYTYGTVVNASSNSVEIIEYDDETYEEVRSTYQTTLQTEWIDGISYQDIRSGDEVDIEYQMMLGQRIALSIEKFNYPQENEEDLFE